MSMDSRLSEDPPTYDDQENEMLHPVAFIIAGTNILAESTDSVPLYSLSRAVAMLTTSTAEVAFERIERQIKVTSDEPMIKTRARHIYTLKYITTIPGGLGARVHGWESPNVYIQSVSRRTLGHLGIKRSRFLPKTSLKVLPLDMSGDKIGFGLPSFLTDTGPIFHIQIRSDGTSIWKDKDNAMIAVQHLIEGQHKLITTTSLPRQTVDALVALWCGRVWQYSDESTTPLHEGLNGGELLKTKPYVIRLDLHLLVRRKFRLAGEIQP
jgi:hypothetical protein